ncbi:MAG: cell division protein FtsA, partial [Deltaproteobacteria bacterium]|nr:cell division protein FtsA [Deltaproteobacteria bacterium]
MGRKTKTMVAIDIGTTKVSAIVGEIEPDGVAITGASSQPAYGVKKGCIINMDSTVDSIKKAVEEVGVMTGNDIHTALVSITGSHVKGCTSNGVIPLSTREVRKHDISGALEAAKALVIPMDREVLHILPQEYIIDDQDGINNPLGMAGVRLESRVYIVTGAVSAAQNIIRCTNRSGLRVKDIVLQPLAAAEAVLSNDEKELGCVMIDMGGGTTDIAVFNNGSIQHCAVLPIGGNHITSDIAIGIRTPITEAEEIKKLFGKENTDAEHNIRLECSGIGEDATKSIASTALSHIIESRVNETFGLIQHELEAAGCLEHLAAGAILTGGTSLLGGICDIASRQLGVPVRIGQPQGVTGITDVRTPAYAAGVGLILFAAQGHLASQAQSTGMPITFGRFG